MDIMRKRKLVKLLAWIVIILVGVGIVIRALLNPVADATLRSLLSKGDIIPAHEFDFRKVRVNLINFSASLSDFTISPDSVLLAKDIPDSLAFVPVIRLKVAKVSLTNLKLKKLFFDKKLDISSIIVSSPNIRYQLPRKPIKKSKIKVDEAETDTIPSSDFNSYVLETIEIDNGYFVLHRYEGDTILVSKDYSLLVEKITYFNTTSFDPTSDFSISDITVRLGNNSYLLPGDMYTLKTGTIEISYSDSLWSLRDIALVPNYSETEFGWKNGWQTDRFDIKIPRIDLRGIRFGNFIENMVVRASELTIQDPVINIYRDKNVPFDDSKFPKLPHQAIVSIPLPIKIDSISVSNATLEYKEVPEKGKKPGRISLQKGEVTITGLSNLLQDIDSGESLYVDGEFQLQGKAPLKIDIEMPLNQKNGEFYYWGSIGPMGLTELSTMTEYAEGIIIHDGKLDSFTFDIAANSVGAKGPVRFLYHDLNILMLKGKEKDDQKKVGSFMTSLANAVARKANPDEKKGIRVAEVDFERNINKGIVNLMVKPLIKGMITTAVIPGNKNIVYESEQKIYTPKEARKKRKEEKRQQKNQK